MGDKGEERPPEQEDKLKTNIRMLASGAFIFALVVFFNYLMEGEITMMSILRISVLVGITGLFLWKR